MAHAAIDADHGIRHGIHAVDRPLAVTLLRSGSIFHLACSECHGMIARGLKDADDLHSRTELIARHRAECMGPRQWWIRRMIRLFAVS